MRKTVRSLGAIVLCGALAGLFGVAAPAAAQSAEDALAMVRTELGDPDLEPNAAYLQTFAALQGAWLMTSWNAFASLTPEKLAEACERLPTLLVAADMTAEWRYRRRDERLTMPVRIAAWQGRLVSIEFDEKAYVEDFLRIPEDQRSRSIGLNSRSAAHRLMLLTPRGPNLLIGYGVLGGGDATVFYRCAAP